MPRHVILLGRISGIAIGLDYSWFLIFVLVTWMLAVDYFPAEYHGWPVGLYWGVAAATAVLFFASVLLHELGHAAVATRYRVPVRGITLFIFGGVAQIAAEPPTAVAEFAIAVAGPAVSLLLAALFDLIRLGVGASAPLLALTQYLAYINGVLAVFNLVPGFPLDGGRVLRAVLWGAYRDLRHATLVAATVGRFVAFLFILVGVTQIFAGHVGNGVWIALVGWFLESAAISQVQQHAAQRLLAGHPVSAAMRTDYATVPATTSLRDLVDRYILASGRRSFLVQQDDRLVGLLTLHQVKDVPREAWGATTAAQAMVPLAVRGRLKSVRPDTELWEAVEAMDRDGVNQLPVVTDSRVLGVLSRDDVLSYLRTLRELQR